MKAGIFLLATLLSATALSAEKRGMETGCDLKTFCEQRKAILDAPAKRVNDRVVNGRKLSGGNLDYYQNSLKCANEGKCSHLDTDRIRKLFQEAKTRIPNRILRGRSIDQLTPIEQAFMTKIKTLTFANPSIRGACQDSCRAYTSAKLIGNEVCVCPRMEGYTDEHLLFVMAHEMGHAIDICAEPAGLKKYDPQTDHPFSDSKPSSVSTCLRANGIESGRDKDELGGRKRSDAFIRSNAPKTVGEVLTWPVIGAATEMFAKHSVAKDNPHFDHPDCKGPLGNSKMQEAMADEIGFEVLGDFLQDYPLSEEDQKTAAPRILGFMLRETCGDEKEDHDPFDHHPSATDRIFKIAMGRPEIRDALGCKGHSQKLDCSYRPESPGLAPNLNVTDTPESQNARD